MAELDLNRPVDVLLSAGDVTPEALAGEISELLGVDYLSSRPVLEPPFKGILLYGTNTRQVISLPVQLCEADRNRRQGDPSRLKYANVHFLSDSGSPFTYMCQTAWRALGIDSTAITVSRKIDIAGVDIEVRTSDQVPLCHDINLLGENFRELTKSMYARHENYGKKIWWLDTEKPGSPNEPKSYTGRFWNGDSLISLPTKLDSGTQTECLVQFVVKPNYQISVINGAALLGLGATREDLNAAKISVIIANKPLIVVHPDVPELINLCVLGADFLSTCQLVEENDTFRLYPNVAADVHAVSGPVVLGSVATDNA